MPVLGHAFVGLATALVTRLATTRRSVAQFWAPLVVTLAYLPDIITQAAALVGNPAVRHIAHSIPVAAIISIPVAIAIAKTFNTSRMLALAVTFVSLLIHIVLDLLQATDRTPWWPLYNRPVGFNLDFIPTNSVWEAVVFGIAFVVFGLGCALANWLRGSKIWPAVGPRTSRRSSPWSGRSIVLLIVLVASATHYLRGVREEVFQEVRTLLGDHRFEAAIALMPAAQRWPSTAKPGRLDYVMAEAYLGMGDPTQAEDCYRRSYALDPSYFWVVADYALMIARSDESVQERRSRVAPLVRSLRDEFVSHPDQARMLAKIERALAADKVLLFD